jgi:hypothetical protein
LIFISFFFLRGDIRQKSHFHHIKLKVYTISMTCHQWCSHWSPGRGSIHEVSSLGSCASLTVHAVLCGKGLYLPPLLSPCSRVGSCLCFTSRRTELT